MKKEKANKDSQFLNLESVNSSGNDRPHIDEELVLNLQNSSLKKLEERQKEGRLSDRKLSNSQIRDKVNNQVQSKVGHHR